MSTRMTNLWILKKALANMRYELEVERVDLEFHLMTYDMPDKDLVTAKRQAEIALHEFRIMELLAKIEAT
jgi:hypothetical protein